MAFVRRDFIKGLAALMGWGALAPAAAAVRAMAPRVRAAPVLDGRRRKLGYIIELYPA